MAIRGRWWHYFTLEAGTNGSQEADEVNPTLSCLYRHTIAFLRIIDEPPTVRVLRDLHVKKLPPEKGARAGAMRDTFWNG
jgi:hypothetical protein